MNLILENITKPVLISEMLEFLRIIYFPVLIAVLLGIPLGLGCVRIEVLKKIFRYLAKTTIILPFIAIAGIFQGAGLFAVQLILGIYAFVMLIYYMCEGIGRVDESTLECFRTMGFDGLALIWKVYIPEIFPFFLTGLRRISYRVLALGAILSLVKPFGLGGRIFYGKPGEIVLASVALIAVVLIIDGILFTVGKILFGRKSLDIL